MLCVPDLTAALERGMIDMEGFKAVQLAMIAHCELMADRVAILRLILMPLRLRELRQQRSDLVRQRGRRHHARQNP